MPAESAWKFCLKVLGLGKSDLITALNVAIGMCYRAANYVLEKQCVGVSLSLALFCLILAQKQGK